ncbi:hypothetical protein Leucomu_03615 [Leucobacter muris]|uniref:Head-to-tail stopper n=1 Tax=Leucobacter muris TaxID=1935379 RepID=A0ABX5QDR8_9MICO|nr:hypothetical protein [Leucobacter muris]QAB17130.1 hypothetical protein Leucomu_03615 [Leucobacter muris]
MRRRITDYVDRLPYLADGTDELGDPVESWGPPESVGIYEFSPGGSIEPPTPGHDRVITTPTLYLPYGCPFKPRDRCEIDGGTYEVEGWPARWKHRRTGRTFGDTVNLKLVEG